MKLDSMQRSNIRAGFAGFMYGAQNTLKNPEKQDATYFALAACEEAGECAGKIAKAIRDDDGVITWERKNAIELEIGDVLWNLANLSRVLGLCFGQVALKNMDKVFDRVDRGVIGGEGDNR